MARIKGTAMVNVVKSLRKLAKTTTEPLVPKPLEHYLSERILPSSWYPEHDHLELLRVLGTLLRPMADAARENVYIFMGRHSAQADMETVYASLVSASTVDNVFRRGATLWQSYHDTGTMKVTMVAPTEASVELAGYALLSPEMCQLTTGWFMGFLDAGAGSDIRVVETSCRNQGAPTCAWSVAWR